MKKLLLLSAILLAAVALRADEAKVDVGFWFDCPKTINSASVEGVRFGLPVSSSQGAVEGAELSLCLSGTRKVEGLQFSLFGGNLSDRMEGVQLSFINWVNGRLNGLQWGFFNHSQADGLQVGFLNNCHDNAKFQFGLININRNGWLPVMIFVNFGRDTFR